MRGNSILINCHRNYHEIANDEKKKHCISHQNSKNFRNKKQAGRMLLATITERATLQQTFNAAQQKIPLKHFDF